jgi:hypothetical protein
MILHRALQLFGTLALLGCAMLAFQGTPWGGEGWSRARILYAAAGAVSALALIAIGGLGLALRRQQQRLDELRETLARIEGRRG